MHAERSDSPFLALATETARVVMMLLLSSEHSPWSLSELQTRDIRR